ncbi:ATP-binding protein [Lunatibacter salilacus]|uniref:ATP-binding protein n=1 Tax=Lunatibacter salilacus TaxID=2483804 RepID=UPI00131B22C8|nr:AAA family ATPase [Lunatibacter salilacus]
MGFKRQAFSYLIQWKNSIDKRKPLIIRGARQVGKTTLVKDFAKTYEHSILLNLEKTLDRAFFEDLEDVHSIAEALFLSNNIRSEKTGETLLFLDEIQESPKAIHLLRYFYEEIPQLHVIAAGSLLEFALKDVRSFPVGRVQFLYLHPLNFLEYLEAVGNKAAIERTNEIPIKKSVHKVLMGLFHRYAIIGGMPEIIRTELSKNNLADLPQIYESIWGTYKSDIEKYAGNDNERKIIRHLMETAPLALDQRIKFQGFGNSNYRSREVGECFRSLEHARILRLIYPTKDLKPPVQADIKKAPRVQMLDTGLVNYTLGIQGQLLGMEDFGSAYKGSLIPHLVTQELISLQVYSDQKPNFWVREKNQSSAEVDLVYVWQDKIIPIEIKSGATGSLRSLHQFVEIADHPYAVRIYGGIFQVEKTQTPQGKPYLLMNLPYYLGTKIRENIEWFIKNH